MPLPALLSIAQPLPVSSPHPPVDLNLPGIMLKPQYFTGSYDNAKSVSNLNQWGFVETQCITITSKSSFRTNQQLNYTATLSDNGFVLVVAYITTQSQLYSGQMSQRGGSAAGQFVLNHQSENSILFIASDQLIADTSDPYLEILCSPDVRDISYSRLGFQMTITAELDTPQRAIFALLDLDTNTFEAGWLSPIAAAIQTATIPLRPGNKRLVVFSWDGSHTQAI
jgi:hypothetical protein